jgi:uncharacterized protein with ParB-like and HNH nuclease domain
MSELIYSIKDIFTNSKKSFIKENEYYNIPEYQRGYKWSKENVKTLLYDILKFQQQNITVNGQISELFYCVQNITLCKHDEMYYNVVDGQQRLTTILIILSYLGDTISVVGKLKYSIRNETDEFINEYIIGRSIWNYESWEDLSKAIDQKYNRKDVFYISEAALAIKEWFEKENLNKLHRSTILNSVKLIVNNLTGANEEKIFSNLNGGKVSLDGADLIRGILMTRVAGEILGDDKNKERINEHRVRIGMELDAINLWWGIENVSKYFKQLLPDKITNNKSFDIINFPINTLYMMYYEIYAKDTDEFSFKFFEYGIDNNNRLNDDHLEMYQGILKLHYEMQDWFVNREIYHLIGYLFNHFKGNELTFRLVWKKWKEANSKKDFIEELKSNIFQQLIKVYNEEEGINDNIKFEEFNNSIIELNSNWYDDNQNLFRTLVLMDIIQITKSNNLGFLPVDFFKPKLEDKEHIRPQTPRKDNEESRSRIDWKLFITDLPKTEQDAIDYILEKSLTDELTEETMISIRKIINKLGLNSIGNLVLLNLSVNRAYGNAAYIEKRRKILNNYMEGKYIRPHTLNAFVKKDSSPEDLNKWEFIDIKQNAERISDELKMYFNSLISK